MYHRFRAVSPPGGCFRAPAWLQPMSRARKQRPGPPGLTVLLALLAVAPHLDAQGFPGLGAQGKAAPHVTWKVTLSAAEVARGGEIDAVAAYDLAHGYHLYAPDHAATGEPTRLTLADSPHATPAGALKFPAPLVKDEPVLKETLRLLEGKGEIRLPLKIAAGAPPGELELTVKLGYMTCNDTGCDPPRKTEHKVKVTVKEAAPAAASPPAAAPPAPAVSSPTPRRAAAPTSSVEIKKSHVTWKLTFPTEIRAGEKGELVLAYEVEKNWHLYSPDHTSAEGIGVPTRIVSDPAGLDLSDKPTFPAPVEEKGELTFGETHRYLVGKGEIRQPFRLPGTQKPGTLEIPLKIEFMSCDVGGTCVPGPAETTISVKALEAEATPEIKPAPGGEGAPRGPGDQGKPAPDGGVQAPPPADPPPAAPPARPPVGPGAALPAAAPPAAQAPPGSFWGFILLCIGGGLLTLIMPCTYPMIPITISFFTKQAEVRRGNVLPLALAYGAGIVLVFLLIGWAFARSITGIANNPWLNLIFGLVFVVFALSLFGLYEIRLPAFFNRAASRASGVGGYLGVFLLGATLVITSFTCTAPVMGGILALAVQGGNAPRVSAGMAVFGLTLAAPFVALSLLPGRARQLPRAGEWMHTAKVYLGFIEVAAAFKFFSTTDVAWQLEVFPRELFLLLCGGTVVLGGLYLLGLYRLREESAEGVSPTRLAIGLVSTLLGVYFLWGASGFKLDRITEALSPPYSAPRVGAANGAAAAEREESWTLVEDDDQATLAAAAREGKLALFNFTGVTCVNCRLMEKTIFPKVADLLKASYVEGRLHTDKQKDQAQIERSKRLQDLKVKLTNSEGNPIYVIIDPARPDQVVDRFDGADLGGAEFRKFLARNRK